jgi:hypothetical protein
MDIAVALPGSDFVDESLFVGNPAVEALRGKSCPISKLGYLFAIEQICDREYYSHPLKLSLRVDGSTDPYAGRLTPFDRQH